MVLLCKFLYLGSSFDCCIRVGQKLQVPGVGDKLSVVHIVIHVIAASGPGDKSTISAMS